MSEYRAGDPHGESNESPEAIEADIAQTRDEMSSTIDAIQARLNPEVLKAQMENVVQERVEEVKEHVQEAITEHVETVKAQVHDATIGRVETMVSNVSEGMRGSGNGLLDTIKANPVPTALLGASLGWLLTNRQNGGVRQQSRMYRNTSAPRGTVYGDGRYVTGGYSSGGYSSGGYTNGGYSNDEPSVGDRIGDVASGAKERVGQFADATGERVGAFKDQAGGQVGNLSTSLLDTIKANPVPTALIGLGVGWLLTNHQNSNTQLSHSYRGTSAYRGPAYDDARYASGEYRGYNDEQSSVGDRIGDVASSAKDHVAHLADTTGDRVSSLKDQAGDTVNTLRDQAGDQVSALTDRAQDTAVQAKSSFQQTLDENPLTIGALAVAVGLAAGLALPGTPVEDRAFGEARDNLVGQMQAKAQDTIQKVQQVAQDVQQSATQTAKDSAQRQGLATTP